MLRAATALIAAAASALAVGCGDRAAQQAPRPPASGVRSAPTAFAPQCGVVSGGLPRDYRSHSFVVGPLALYRAAEWARYPSSYMTTEREGFRRALRGERRPRERRRLRAELRRSAAERIARYPAFETALTVGAGHRATITVIGTSRAHFAWLFDPRAWIDRTRGYRVRDGEQAIHVSGCERPYAQYQGGFVVDGPRCVAIAVSIDGRRAVRRRFAVGSTARCVTGA